MNKNGKIKHYNDYTFNHYKDRLNKIKSENKLEAIIDDIEGDFEAGNLNEEQVEILKSLICDKEGEILVGAIEEG